MEYNIFVYGSLMCPKSCERTLGRVVNYLPVKLKNYRRIFNAVGRVFSDELNDTTLVKFANLQFTESSNDCHGLIIKINKKELEKLCKREYLYQLVDVSEYIDELKSVYTFIAYEDNSEGLILEKYLNIMKNATLNYPTIYNQIKEEIKELNRNEILTGGFSSISGYYK